MNIVRYDPTSTELVRNYSPERIQKSTPRHELGNIKIFGNGKHVKDNVLHPGRSKILSRNRPRSVKVVASTKSPRSLKTNTSSLIAMHQEKTSRLSASAKLLENKHNNSFSSYDLLSKSHHSHSQESEKASSNHSLTLSEIFQSESSSFDEHDPNDRNNNESSVSSSDYSFATDEEVSDVCFTCGLNDACNDVDDYQRDEEYQYERKVHDTEQGNKNSSNLVTSSTGSKLNDEKQQKSYIKLKNFSSSNTCNDVPQSPKRSLLHAIEIGAITRSIQTQGQYILSKLARMKSLRDDDDDNDNDNDNDDIPKDDYVIHFGLDLNSNGTVWRTGQENAESPHIQLNIITENQSANQIQKQNDGLHSLDSVITPQSTKVTKDVTKEEANANSIPTKVERIDQKIIMHAQRSLASLQLPAVSSIVARRFSLHNETNGYSIDSQQPLINSKKGSQSNETYEKTSDDGSCTEVPLLYPQKQSSRFSHSDVEKQKKELYKSSTALKTSNLQQLSEKDNQSKSCSNLQLHRDVNRNNHALSRSIAMLEQRLGSDRNRSQSYQTFEKVEDNGRIERLSPSTTDRSRAEQHGSQSPNRSFSTTLSNSIRQSSSKHLSLSTVRSDHLHANQSSSKYSGELNKSCGFGEVSSIRNGKIDLKEYVSSVSKEKSKKRPDSKSFSSLPNVKSKRSSRASEQEPKRKSMTHLENVKRSDDTRKAKKEEYHHLSEDSHARVINKSISSDAYFSMSSRSKPDKYSDKSQSLSNLYDKSPRRTRLSNNEYTSKYDLTKRTAITSRRRSLQNTTIPFEIGIQQNQSPFVTNESPNTRLRQSRRGGMSGMTNAQNEESKTDKFMKEIADDDEEEEKKKRQSSFPRTIIIPESSDFDNNAFHARMIPIESFHKEKHVFFNTSKEEQNTFGSVVEQTEQRVASGRLLERGGRINRTDDDDDCVPVRVSSPRRRDRVVFDFNPKKLDDILDSPSRDAQCKLKQQHRRVSINRLQACVQQIEESTMNRRSFSKRPTKDIFLPCYRPPTYIGPEFINGKPVYPHYL